MTDKMRMESPNVPARNVEKIAALFPNCVVETTGADGRPTFAVDVDALRETLGARIAPPEREAYEFTWVGKRAARAEAFAPIRKTLRPCVEESKDWETTKNVYIEGDNLDVLKLLQESYLGKVKMIYIDPPYNTGNDFIYRDNFSMTREEYDEETGAVDNETGERLFKNANTSGRFHSDWCSMIYPRLLLARNLLSDDGVIFISIDDNEVANLTKICDEIFGRGNFVGQVNWKGRGGRQDSKYYASIHEYILVYAKSKNQFIAGEEIKSGDVFPKYDTDKKRFYKTQLLRKWGSNSRREDRPNLFYPISAPDGTDVYPMLNNSVYSVQNTKNYGRWRHGVSVMQQNIANGKVEFIKQSNGTWVAYEKIFAPFEGDEATKKYTTWIDETNDGAKTLKNLFNANVFDYPKTVELLLRFLKMGNVDSDSLILDFFSGSSTTAHAVMLQNVKLEGGGGVCGSRKFIMVQLPEPCDEKSEAFKAGYRNICEIGKERIRRAGEKIKAENPLLADSLDVGFRVFKVADSNMKDVYYDVAETSQTSLLDLVSNVKEDRTPLDLLFQCLLEWGLPLSRRCVLERIDDRDLYVYGDDGDGNLDDGFIACFDENIPESVVEYIARRKPLRAVFRDSSFKDSPAKINALEIFKRFNPENADDVENRVKVI